MECWPGIILSTLAGTLGIYYYFFREKNYFKVNGIPYLPWVPLFGGMARKYFCRVSFADMITSIYNFNREAKYVGFYNLRQPTVVIRDPELIKSIGVKNFESFPNHRNVVESIEDPDFGKNLFLLKNEEWREARTMLSPAFTSSKMRSMFKLMNDCAKNFADFMSKIPAEKRSMDVKDKFARYTTDVIASCAFGINVDSMKNPNNKFYAMGKEMTSFNEGRFLKFLFIILLPKVASFLKLTIFKESVAKFFRETIRTTIRVREAEGTTRPDMIQLMIEARDKREPGNELTIQEMTSQAFIFFFAGFESTSTLMCFTAHEVALNPDVYQRLQNEVDEILQRNNGEATYEEINGMEYLDAVLSEVLRMYPVALMVDRVASRSFELPPALPGGKPFIIKKGMDVWFPVYGLHHDPQYFEDPSKFDPNRFLGENKKNVHGTAYMPFGIGPRMCIGNRFALLETKVLFFHLLARCNLARSSKTCVPLKIDKKGFNMIPEGNKFWLAVGPRTPT